MPEARLAFRAMVHRAIALYLGLFIATLGLFGWYFLHDHQSFAVDQQVREARQVAARLSQRLGPQLAPEGAIDVPWSADRLDLLAALIDDAARDVPVVARVVIVIAGRETIGPFVRGADGRIVILDEARSMPNRPNLGDPDDPRRTFDRPNTLMRGRLPRAVAAPVLGGIASLIVLLDPKSIELAVIEVRWRALGKLAIVAVVSLLLGGIGFSYTFSLVRRTRKLTEESQRGKQLASLGTLASGLAHEIRNPLNAMNINLELLEEDVATGQLGAESLELLRASRSEVLRLEQLVKDFLAFARPRAAITEEIVPGELVADVVRFSRPEFAKAGVALELKHEDIAPTVRVDTGQLRQAILNVLSNALDASRAGGKVEVVVGPTVQGEAKIVIRDEGEGIAREDLNHIFEIFWSKKLKTPGSGLGLPIALRAVEEHGGRIDVESTPGQGATFTMILPPAAMSPRGSAGRDSVV